jgi:hypothetical protein
MFKFLKKLKKKKQLENKNQEPQNNNTGAVSKDIPVSHLIAPFTIVTPKGPVSVGHPHVMVEFFSKNKGPNPKDNESRE